MAAYEWTPRVRHYEIEKRLISGIEVLNHPLKKAVQVSAAADKSGASTPLDKSESSSRSGDDRRKNKHLEDKQNHVLKRPEFIDPLGAALQGENGVGGDEELDADLPSTLGLDAVSRLALSAANAPSDLQLRNSLEWDSPSEHEASLVAPAEPELVGFEPWTSRRARILQHYSTDQKLSIVTSFLPGGAPLETRLAVADKTAHRMEQFDDRTSMKRLAELSQHEYVSKINELNAELRRSWAVDQRVQSVKVVIEAAKLLGDCSVPPFYPSQFVLVTDILDSFGRLVYSRLWSKANSERRAASLPPLSHPFALADVPETTRETARNWFFKIASVRELLPRLLVEASIVRCLRFVDGGESMAAALERLAATARGVAHPLVAAYVRCYLCRVGVVVLPRTRLHVWKCLHDLLQTWKQPAGPAHLPYPEARLVWPAMEWMVQCVAHGASDDELLPVWEYCRQDAERRRLLLTPVLNVFPPRYLADNAVEVAQCVLMKGVRGADPDDNSSTDDLAATLKIGQTFGQRLLVSEPQPHVKRALLREVWKLMMRFKSLDDYVACAEVWIEFTCRHFGTNEVNTLLEDLVRHVLPDKLYESYYPQLLSILNKIVQNQPNFQLLFSMERFVAFLDLFRKDSIRLQACHCLLSVFCRRQQQHLSSERASAAEDLALSNHVMNLCKQLHDSLNALSFDDEYRTAVKLICSALDRFRFDDDPEQALTFLVDARANFSNLDDVVEYLVRRVNVLSMETRARVGGRHSRKTAYFTRAAVANAFITIPSIVDPFRRFRLYLDTAGVALINNCLPQADAVLKACVGLVGEMPTTTEVFGGGGRRRSTEPTLIELVSDLLSLLLVVPDPPEHAQPLYLLRGLLAAVHRYPWPSESDGKATVLIRVLAWLSTSAQADYPYHIESVESNDSLYGGGEQFTSALNATSSEVLQQVLAHMKTLNSPDMHKRQARVALDLLDCTIAFADLSTEQMHSLAVALWNLARKVAQPDRARLKATVETLTLNVDRWPGCRRLLEAVRAAK